MKNYSLWFTDQFGVPISEPTQFAEGLHAIEVPAGATHVYVRNDPEGSE